MSIYDFINSPDIREHWEKIGYKPSPPEMARRERMLVPISRYLKGEIDLALLLGACRMITLEMQKNETNSLLGCLPTSLKIV